MDPPSSLMGIDWPCIDGKFGPKKDLGMVSKCGFKETQRGLNKLATTLMHTIVVASLQFYKFPLAGKNFNFLGVRVGSNENNIPNELILILKVITNEICKARKGTLSAVLFLKTECSTNQAVPGQLRIAEHTY